MRNVEALLSVILVGAAFSRDESCLANLLVAESRYRDEEKKGYFLTI